MTPLYILIGLIVLGIIVLFMVALKAQGGDIKWNNFIDEIHDK